MLDYALENALVGILKSVPALAKLNFYTGHSGDARHTPSITVESRSESLAGSAVVFRSETTIIIESEANDTAPEAHSALVEAVRGALGNKAAVAATVNLTGALKLYGYALSGSMLAVEATRFRTTITLRVGYGVA